MVVYLDLIFLTNLCFDTAIVMMTAKLRGLKLSRKRTALAVLLGASYVLLMFQPAFALLYTVVAKLIFSLFVVYVAFGFGSLQMYIRTVGVFYLVHFAAAGAVFAVHFFLLSSGDVMNRLLLQPSGSIAFAIDSGLWLSVPVFFLALLFLRSVFVSKGREDALAAQLASVQVTIGDVVVSCNGMIDTGNRLYDPISRAPVLVMELALWQQYLPRGWMPYIKGNEVDRLFADEAYESFQWGDRLRLIPYRGVNASSRFMLAIKPDNVIINSGDDTVETSKVLVAIDGGTLAAGGAYQAIIHPVLITSA